MGLKFDFSGWATRNNLKCTDGRVIRRDAFKDDDGSVVPLMWQHDHSSPASCLGHAVLENRNDGVYAYCILNEGENAQAALEAVRHGDLDSLSIYANRLTQNGHDVVHGSIQEVSLVMHGANPGAYIDNIIQHADGSEAYGEEGFIYNDEIIDCESEYFFCHSSDGVFISDEDIPDEEPDADDVDDDDDELEHADMDKKTVKDVLDSLTEEQQAAVYFVIGEAVKEAKGKKSDDEDEDEENTAKHSDDIEGGEDFMKHNAFDSTYDAVYPTINTTDANALMHGEELRAETDAIFADAMRKGMTLKDSIMAHAATYGIEDIDWLFPDAKNYTTEPEFISRNMEWVTVFLNGVKHSPFSRIKTMFADITADAARAKGYTKGNIKIEEVFSLLKRITVPTTVYKKQAFDRDDVIDIKDFDVVAYTRKEMRVMLNEELARAMLVGDGRDPVQEADDKIDETCIRPIYTDADLFSVKVTIPVAQNADSETKAKALVKAAIKARKNYKGSGNPIFFTTEDTLADLLLVEDGVGRRLYRTKEELATALLVSKIVTVEVMEGLTRTVGEGQQAVVHTLAGIIVNPIDYVVGADKGGEINTFDDFDIDYNRMKYLMETRCSGCLVKPKSALVLEYIPAQG